MKYDFKLNIESANDSLSLILKRVRPNSTVLEFGCANGRMTAYLSQQLKAEVYAVELDPEAAEFARPHTKSIHIGDIESYEWLDTFEGIKFDYITFADVLEHLYKPAEVIQVCKKVLKQDGSLLLSVPNAAHNAIVMQLLRDQFEYQPIGLLDDTHIRFFTKCSLDKFIADADLKIAYQRATFANPEVDLFTNCYEDFDPELASYLKKRDFGEVYQFVVEAKREVATPDIELNRYENCTLFYDTGAGFSADHSCTLVYDFDKKVEIDFAPSEVLKGVKRLRLDPCERSVKTTLGHLEVNGIDYTSKLTHNGKLQDSEIYFHTNDPQLIVEFHSAVDVKTVKLCFANIRVLDGLTRAQLQDEKRQQALLNSQFSAERIDLNKTIAELDKTNTELNEKITELHALAQSMRIKNRLKAAFRRLIPRALHLPLYALRRDPKLVLRALRILRHNGLKGLLDKVRAASRTGIGYEYRPPLLSSSIKSEMKRFDCQPLITIIMPVYNVAPKWLDLAIKSVQHQWYKNWELCLVDDCSTNPETQDYLRTLRHPQIKVLLNESNGNISQASNLGLTMANGDYIALMDNDDELTPDALYEVVRSINKDRSEFIYSDEDKIDLDGKFIEPHFKPDYSPEHLLSQNYMSHLGVIKKSLIDKVGGFTLGLEGAQDYDLYLKVLEHTGAVTHIPRVLYHWRKIPGSTAAEFDSKSYAQAAGKMAIENSLARQGIDAIVSNGPYGGTYRVRYALKSQPLVSIIIPFKDKPELLDMCLGSILKKSTYTNYQILGISNNSCEPETFAMMQRYEKQDSRIKFYEYNIQFNYSAINNYAAGLAEGDQLILLNNDIEILTPDWIEELLSFSQKDDVGCVGAKLYYPNDHIQHAGIILGIGGVAGHSHKYFPRDDAGYFSRLALVQNVSAVTAACLMVKRAIFETVGGLDEMNLSVAFNDVDFCLRVRELGLRNVFTPYCEAYHHESISRGAEDSAEKIKRFNREIAYMQERHADILKNGDPHYNSNLTLSSEDFNLR